MIRAFFRFVFQSIFWVCAFFGFLLVSLLLFLYLSKNLPFQSAVKPVEHDSVLTLNLHGHYLEHTDTSGLGALFLGKQASLYNLTRAIHDAAQNKKIKGLVLHIEEPHLGVAQIQELRDALMAFRKAGKPSWCYSESFGESSPGTGLYYLATGCQEVWLQPLGGVNLTGLSVEIPFAKEALEKLDVKPELAQRKEYKSYFETFTRDNFSEPNREETQAILDSILSQFVEGIAKERNLPHDHVRFLINNGPYLTEESLKEKLVDRVDYRQNLKEALQVKLGKHIKFIGLDRYLATLPEKSTGSKVALIFGSGTIFRDGKESPVSVMITANEAYKVFQAAVADPDVKAIVYRLNSGGGSPVASETIYGIVNDAKLRAKKPVIISMSDAAASGGYWIAAAGSKIVSQPGTLTGSIGVAGGKFVLSGLFDKLGIKFGHVSTSENANLWSMAQSFTPQQWIKFNASMDQIYKEFTDRVASGRHMTPEQVEKVARGRVWTGEQALALGLVDQLGDLHVALDLAKKEANLPLNAGIQIYPEHKTLLESLSALVNEEEDDHFVQQGILGVIINPFKKMMAVLNLLMSSKETLYVPVGEVK